MSVLAPPVAFVAYIGLVSVLLVVSRILAGPHRSSTAESALYASGEAAQQGRNVGPGYAGFFGIALFFGVLHVGVLIAATGGVSIVGAIYVVGLLAVLVVAGLA